MESNDKEIERKYLLSGLPAGVTQYRSEEIDQGYIPGLKVRERVRRIRDGSSVSYLRTIKLGSGVERFEFEEETTEAFFAAVWPLTAGHRVHKRRYRVPVEDGEWEIDEFLDRTDLVLAEYEMTHADHRPEPPPFIA